MLFRNPLELTRFPAHPIVSQGSQEGVPDGRHPKYPEEFRRESVQLILTTDESMADVARDLAINYKTLGNWVRAKQATKARDSASGALNESERAELKRLKKGVTELRTEREILRKAAAYFAKETTR